MSGTVTLKNRCGALKPSRVAASLSSSGTAWSAARTMMKVRPRFCHTVVSATANIAERGLFRLSQLTSLK